MKTLLEQIKAARRVSTPLLAVTTADQGAAIAVLRDGLNGDIPVVMWDQGRGVRPLNKRGEAMLVKIEADLQALADMTLKIDTALNTALKFDADTVSFWFNAHRFVSERIESTSWLNLRDPYKQTRRTAILLGPQFDLPIELQQDIVIFDDPLPTDDRLALIFKELHSAFREKYTEVAVASADLVRQVVDAARGLSEFAAEQIISMSFRKEGSGVDVDDLWLRKKTQVSQTRGLTFSIGGLSFDMIGGLKTVCSFFKGLFKGKARPGCILRIDEIEKHLAGAGGDTTGISQDFVGVLLRTMEDLRWGGLVAFGPPGCAKSLLSKVVGASFGVPTLELDLGALKGSLVGESEQAIRNALKVVNGIGNGKVFVIATCNRLEIIPPELKRRFTSGIWYFGIPQDAEQTAIWNIHLKAHPEVKPEWTFNDDNWTGAEIRNVVELADNNGITLDEASEFIVPVSVSDPSGIEKTKDIANGRFLNAAAPGVYRKEGSSVEPASTERRVF